MGYFLKFRFTQFTIRDILFTKDVDAMKTNALRALRRARHLTQAELAECLGVSKSAVAMWEGGRREPDVETLQYLSEFFGVSLDELTENAPLRPRSVRIPVLGRVQAGIPLDAVEDILDYEEIPAELAENGEYFALQIRGQSMEPRFREGDVVIVRRQADVESGEIAIVLVNGDLATVKKLVKQKNGVSLVPLNPAFDPLFYSEQEISSLPVRVLGRVVELRAKF